MSGKKRSEVIGLIRGIADLIDCMLDPRLGNCDRLLDSIAKIANENSAVAASFASSDAIAPDRLQSARDTRRDIVRNMDALKVRGEALNRELDKRAGDDDWFTSEYEKAEAIMTAFKTIGKQTIPALQENLEQLQKAWKAIVAEYHEKMSRLHAEATTGLACLKTRISHELLNDPRTPSKKAITIREFCSNVLKDSSRLDVIEQQIDSIAGNISRGEYEQAIDQCGMTERELTSWVAELNSQSEAIQLTLWSAKEIITVLTDMGMRVGSEIIGDDLTQGFRVTTENPNASEFLCAPSSIEGGEAPVNITFNIDGLSSGASCKYTANKLQTALRKQGLGIKITDYGTEKKKSSSGIVINESKNDQTNS